MIESPMETLGVLCEDPLLNAPMTLRIQIMLIIIISGMLSFILNGVIGKWLWQLVIDGGLSKFRSLCYKKETRAARGIV